MHSVLLRGMDVQPDQVQQLAIVHFREQPFGAAFQYILDQFLRLTD